MQPHEARVVNEKNELDIKANALRAFFGTSTYDNLSDEEKLLLVKQLNAMTTYSDILDSRIKLFGRTKCGPPRHADEDLGELDKSKACQDNNESCESCS